MRRSLRSTSFSKGLRRLPGDHPGTAAQHCDRDLVGRRLSASDARQGRAEEQDHPPLGQTRHPASGATRPENTFGLRLWRDLPARGKGAGLVLLFCNIAAMNLHLVRISETSAPGAHTVLLMDQPTDTRARGSWSRPTSPSCSCRHALLNLDPLRGSSQSGTTGSSCATTGSQTGCQVRKRHRRPLLLRLEPARGSVLESHAHLHARLGSCVLIKGIRYQAAAPVRLLSLDRRKQAEPCPTCQSAVKR